MGPQKIARFFWGAVKIAAAAAENRAILVHSDPQDYGFSLSALQLAGLGAQEKGTLSAPHRCPVNVSVSLPFPFNSSKEEALERPGMVAATKQGEPTIGERTLLGASKF